ncbi:MAG TPA: FAD-dependent oxidoreductase [Phycisphaerales bacterium]|nr:FAD-dependent oxidoreductase [Phycisphaerales bacterium]
MTLPFAHTPRDRYRVIVIGGGHAGVEAAWAAANLLPEPHSVALVTLDPAKIGVMSCNPAIGGLAKGQIVREIDAMGGVMGLAADATGIQFKVLNTSKGAAVHGPRAQCDKHAYADEVQRLIASRPEIDVIAGSVERLVVEGGRITGVVIQAENRKAQSARDGKASADSGSALCDSRFAISSSSVVLTTGTFMRALMHTGETRTQGGRHGEAAAVGISGALRELGFELGRLKTGTPPRLDRDTIDWSGLPPARGDERPVPFSDLSATGPTPRHLDTTTPSLLPFPVLPQIDCRMTSTSAAAHDLIRANLHRAPMYSGQIESAGPRYCPSIEDKVVRFAERGSHGVFLEPESLRPGLEGERWIYCNGISTSLPTDVQDALVRTMPGCERAAILRYGYAVEYDMVRPHQIDATGMTKLVDGLFLAGQINGTSGYEEAAGQGLIAGINAARLARAETPITLGRDAAYIGVLMDDLVTKTPVEPYRMFTSRAEHRLLLRADNAADRLTPLADRLGVLDSTPLATLRKRVFAERTAAMAEINRLIDTAAVEGGPLRDRVRRPDYSTDQLAADLRTVPQAAPNPHLDPASPALRTAHADRLYAPFVERQRSEIRRSADAERKCIPVDFDFAAIPSLRTEARVALERFRPATLGQAGRLEGITPADVTLLSVMLARRSRAAAGSDAGERA